MLRLILPILLLSDFINATGIDVKKLEAEFKKNVIETNIFRKRFNRYLNKNCGDDFNCIQERIEMLKTWDTVQNDKYLQNMFQRKKELFSKEKSYREKIKNKLENKELTLEHSQFISVIDLSRQLLIIFLWDESTKEFHYIGKDHISSGNMEREAEVKYGENHYYKTPSGVFKALSGWRSDGETKDDDLTLGYGKKDRFIFYFGEQKSVRYNTFDKKKEKIYDPQKWKLISGKLQFALHAHESLKMMGEPGSHGCVRTTDELNRFLDNNLILHKNMLKNNKWNHSFIKPPLQAKKHNLAGEYLIVFDKIN